MKIVILEGYPVNPGDLSWECLKEFGEVQVYESTSLTDTQEAIQRIGDAEIVFTNKVPITRAVMDACSNLKFVAVLATNFRLEQASITALVMGPLLVKTISASPIRWIASCVSVRLVLS